MMPITPNNEIARTYVETCKLVEIFPCQTVLCAGNGRIAEKIVDMYDACPELMFVELPAIVVDLAY